MGDAPRLRGMNVGAAALLLGVLAGCGARSSLTEAQESDRPPPSTSPSAASPVQRFDCRVSGGTRPMLAARLGSQLHYVYPDRSSKVVLDLDVPEGMYVTRAGVIARGDRVALHLVANALGGAAEPAPFAEVAVLNVDGTVLLHERHDFAYEGWGSDSQIVGNAAGLFVLTLLEVKAGLGLVIEGDEAHPFTERMAARSDPDAAGRLVVWDADAPSTSDLHFFDTETSTFAPSRYLTEETWEDVASLPAVLASGLLYLRRSPPRLVFEDASGVEERPLDAVLPSPGHATPGYARSGGYVLFMLEGTSPEDARYLATRFESGEVREFRLVPPAGHQLPGDYWNPPLIDARGRVVTTLLAGDTIRLMATADGATWEPLGLPVAMDVLGLSLIEAGGTVLFDGLGGSGMAVPGALPAGTAQLIGPEGGAGIELVRWDPDAPSNPVYAEDELSADGGCLAYFRSGSLHVVEVADYSSSDLGLTTTEANAEMAWIPLPE